MMGRGSMPMQIKKGGKCKPGTKKPKPKGGKK